MEANLHGEAQNLRAKVHLLEHLCSQYLSASCSGENFLEAKAKKASTKKVLEMVGSEKVEPQ
jgi:hypothetical protein